MPTKVSVAAKKTAVPARRPLSNTTKLADSAAVVERTEGEKIDFTAEGDSEVEMATAIVPKAFTLTLDSHQPVRYEAGTQEMPLAHATHWFSRAMGVKVYQPE